MGRNRKAETVYDDVIAGRVSAGREASKLSRRAAKEALAFVRARAAAAPWYFQNIKDYNTYNKSTNYDDE